MKIIELIFALFLIIACQCSHQFIRTTYPGIGGGLYNNGFRGNTFTRVNRYRTGWGGIGGIGRLYWWLMSKMFVILKVKWHMIIFYYIFLNRYALQ
jgi:hypothetical protein